MDANDIDRRLAELKLRLGKLPDNDQERALEGFAQVLNLLALPRESEDTVELTIGLQRGSGVTHRSG